MSTSISASLRRAVVRLRGLGRAASCKTAGSSPSLSAHLVQDQAQIARDYFVRFGATVGLGFAAAGAASGASPASTCTSAVPAADAPPVAPGLVTATEAKDIIVFVLGGPGSGKGTQCARLISEFPDIAHFSAGDLLRAHVKSGTPEGNKVAEMMQQGQIVPSEVTVGLLQDAMKNSDKTKFLIDGFPRNVENRDAFEKVTGRDCDFIIFFDCPEEVMEKRLLGRNEGRADDNIETIRKRFKVFIESSMPVVDHYGAVGKAYKFEATRAPDEIYAEVKRLFM